MRSFNEVRVLPTTYPGAWTKSRCPQSTISSAGSRVPPSQCKRWQRPKATGAVRPTTQRKRPKLSGHTSVLCNHRAHPVSNLRCPDVPWCCRCSCCYSVYRHNLPTGAGIRQKIMQERDDVVMTGKESFSTCFEQHGFSACCMDAPVATNMSSICTRLVAGRILVGRYQPTRPISLRKMAGTLSGNAQPNPTTHLT